MMSKKTLAYVAGALVVAWLVYAMYKKEQQKANTAGRKTDKITIGDQQMHVLLDEPEFGRRSMAKQPLYAGTGDLIATINTF